MEIGIIIDIIILIIIGLSTWLGYKKGLTKSMLKIFNFIIALVVSIVLFKPASMLVMQTTQIDETLQSAIVSNLSGENNNKNSEGNIEENNLPSIFSNYISEEIKNASNDIKDNLIKNAAEQITSTIINIAVLIILYILARIILVFVKVIADLVTKLPVVKQCDKLGGTIYGALRAILILIVIFTIISLLGPIIKDTGIIDIINSSIIGSILYNNNILFNIIF